MKISDFDKADKLKDAWDSLRAFRAYVLKQSGDAWRIRESFPEPYNSGVWADIGRTRLVAFLDREIEIVVIQMQDLGMEIDTR